MSDPFFLCIQKPKIGVKLLVKILNRVGFLGIISRGRQASGCGPCNHFFQPSEKRVNPRLFRGAPHPVQLLALRNANYYEKDCMRRATAQFPVLRGTCKARRIRSIGLNRGEGSRLWGSLPRGRPSTALRALPQATRGSCRSAWRTWRRCPRTARSSWGEVPQLHLLDHALPQRGHERLLG